MSFRKFFRKAVKVVAIAAATYYTGGAALTMYARARAAQQQGQPSGPDPNATQYYSAPFNPGYSYTGPPDAYGSSAFQASGGYGGAAIPAFQSGGESPPSPGFSITPMIAIAGLGALLLGFLAFRR